MLALLDNAAILKHIDLVGMAHRRQAMGDHQTGAAGQKVTQPLVNQQLGFAIQR